MTPLLFCKHRSILQRLLMLKAACGGKIVEHTVSGAIVTFITNLVAPLKQLVAQINSVQDLHGYGSPWPAGGGKNKFNGTFLQGYWAYADGTWVNSPNWITTEKIPCKASTSYTVSADAKATRWQGFVWYDSNGDFISTDNLNSNVNIGLTKTSPSNAAYLIFNIAGYPGANNTIAPSDVTHFQLEEGSSSTAYAPYSNICPISGRTGVSVYRTGVNVWDEQYFVSSNRIQSNYIPVLPNTTYNRVSPNNIIPLYYDSDKNQLSTGTWGTGVFTTPADCYYLRFQVDPAYGETYNHDISINYPSTDTDYHAYQGQTIAVDWTSEAGTVYGGTLDVTTGVLTVNWAKIVLNGTQQISRKNWKPQAKSVGWIYPYDLTRNIVGTGAVLQNIKCDTLPSMPFNSLQSINGPGIALASNQTYGISVMYPNTTLTTESAINAFLAEHPIDVVYELATPQTYQITPTEVATLLGDNTIWASTGDVSVTYYAKE